MMTFPFMNIRGHSWSFVVHFRSLRFILEQRRAEVTFAEAAHDGDDQFALVFGPRRDFRGSGYVTARADATEDAFFLCQPAGPLEGFLVGDLDHLVYDRQV